MSTNSAMSNTQTRAWRPTSTSGRKTRPRLWNCSASIRSGMKTHWQSSCAKMKIVCRILTVLIVAAVLAWASGVAIELRQYELPVTVWECGDDCVTFRDASGNLWEAVCEPLQGDCVLTMDNMGTAEIEDDRIVDVRVVK